MILLREYDKEKRVDRVWYDSSNIVYSECDDKENDYKTLRVVFKNGATYEYQKVDVNDYVMFVNGGLDGSNGRALNKFIKPKCEFKRLDNSDVPALLEEMKSLNRKMAEEKEPENKNNAE